MKKSDFSAQILVGSVLSFTFAAIIGILHVGILYVFGLPVLPFIIGLLLIWTSRSPAQIKSIATLSSLLIIPVSFFVSFQLSKAEAETYLIPKEFRGEVVIFFDEECGSAEEFENGRRVYRIPPNGVLITRFKTNDGYFDHEFFLTEVESTKERIPFFFRQKLETEKNDIEPQDPKRSEALNDRTVGVFWSYGSDTYRLSRQSASFIVSDFGYYSRDQKDRFLEGKHFVETAERLLNECRQAKQPGN